MLRLLSVLRVRYGDSLKNKIGEYDHLNCPSSAPLVSMFRSEGSLAYGFNRQKQTTLTRFRSGHLKKTLNFIKGSKR